MDNPSYEQAEIPSSVPAVDSREVLTFQEENQGNANPISKKNRLQYSYTKDDLIRISKTPLANKPPACLDKLYYNSYGVWEPERWFNETRCETPHSEDGKGNRERSVDNDRDLQPKRRQADTKDIVREEQDGIVLGPQRRSFGTGCHVTHAGTNRRPESPTDTRERERESTRRIGRGRIINREREREFGYRGGRDRFERERDEREKDGRYSRGDRYGRDRGDERRPVRNDKNKGKQPLSVSGKAGSVETTESSSADNSLQSDVVLPPTHNKELDLNDFFSKMDGFPSLVVPNGTPTEAGIELAGSRFCQWFRNKSSPPLCLGPGFDSRRSSFQEELLGPLRRDMDDPFPQFPSPTNFNSTSPEPRRAGDDSGGNIMELLQQAASRASMDSLTGDTGSDIINSVRNVTMKELAMSGKAKSVQELEEGLNHLVLTKIHNSSSPVIMNGPVIQRNINNDLSAFNKLLAQVSEGEMVPAQMGGGFSNTKVLQEKDILKEIVSRISPTPEAVKQDQLSDFLCDNFSMESQSVPSIQQPHQPMNMLQNNSEPSQHSGWGNTQNQEPMRLSEPSQHSGWDNTQNQEPMRLSCWGSDNQETLRASGWGADPNQGLRPSILGQQNTVSPNLNQPVIDHFHNIQQQPFRDKVLSQLNQSQLQQGLPHVNSFQSNQQLIGPAYIPTQTIISGFIPVSQPPPIGMMGRNGPISPHPPSPAIMDPMQQTLQARISSPLLFSQTPPMLSHAPSPIHPNQIQNIINPVTLQPSSMMGRVPSPLELAVHVQQISQNAMVKRKLEEQRENARKRIESRPRSPGFMGGNRPSININDTSPKPAMSSTMANLMPTSVMRKLQADSRDGMKNDIPQMSTAAKNNTVNLDNASMVGSQLAHFYETPGVPASTAGPTFPVRPQQGQGSVPNSYSMGRPIVKGNQTGVDAKGYFKSQGQPSGVLNTNSVAYGSGGMADVNGGPMLRNQVRPDYLGLQTGANFSSVDIARAIEQQRLIQAVQRHINANQANLQMHTPTSMTPVAMNPNSLQMRNMVHPAAALSQLAQMQQSSGVGMDPRFAAAALAAQGRTMPPPMNLQHTMMGPPPSHPQHPPPTSRAQPGLGTGVSTAPVTSFQNSNMHAYQQHNYNMMNKVNHGNVNNPMHYMGLNVKPNISEQVSPNNMLAKFFGNDVLNQSMPNLPSVPTQALSLEEVERRQQIAAVHN